MRRETCEINIGEINIGDLDKNMTHVQCYWWIKYWQFFQSLQYFINMTKECLMLCRAV